MCLNCLTNFKHFLLKRTYRVQKFLISQLHQRTFKTSRNKNLQFLKAELVSCPRWCFENRRLKCTLVVGTVLVLLEGEHLSAMEISRRFSSRREIHRRTYPWKGWREFYRGPRARAMSNASHAYSGTSWPMNGGQVRVGAGEEENGKRTRQKYVNAIQSRLSKFIGRFQSLSNGNRNGATATIDVRENNKLELAVTACLWASPDTSQAVKSIYSAA